MTLAFTKLKSWHLVKPGSWTTLCGRTIASRVTQPSFPVTEKTCEMCWRVNGR